MGRSKLLSRILPTAVVSLMDVRAFVASLELLLIDYTVLDNL